MKLSKCTFAQRSISYLGHIVSEAGVATNPAKVRAITDWPVPANMQELRGFFWLGGVLPQVHPQFWYNCATLNDLLKKDSIFMTSIHASAFQALKTALSSAPILALLDFN